MSFLNDPTVEHTIDYKSYEKHRDDPYDDWHNPEPPIKDPYWCLALFMMLYFEEIKNDPSKLT